eukprot:3641341-Heterocapsa_arctica.AAC.1
MSMRIFRCRRGLFNVDADFRWRRKFVDVDADLFGPEYPALFSVQERPRIFKQTLLLHKCLVLNTI